MNYNILVFKIKEKKSFVPVFKFCSKVSHSAAEKRERKWGRRAVHKNTAWTPRESRGGGGHEAAECLPCPEGGLLQGCTAEGGRQTVCWRPAPSGSSSLQLQLLLTSSLEKAAFLLSRCSWTSSFYSWTPLFTENGTFYKSVYRTFILNWALS